MPYGLVQIVAPTDISLDLDEAKLWLRIDKDQTAEDGLVEELIRDAEDRAQRICERQFLTATWTLTLDRFPLPEKPSNPVYRLPGQTFPQSIQMQGSSDGILRLPRPPLQAVTSIVYLDTTGTPITLDPSLYLVDTACEPGRVAPAYGKVWPTIRDQLGAVTIIYTAGYGNKQADVPAALKQRLKNLVAYAYRNRENPDLLDALAEKLFAQFWVGTMSAGSP